MIHIESIHENNVIDLSNLTLLLWPDSIFEEEHAEVLRILQTEDGTAFLAKHKEEAYIGFVIISLRNEHVEGTVSRPVGYVEGIWVAEPFRKKGIGKKLIQAGEQWCREKGCAEMASDTEISNEMSQFFHERLGFEEVNRIVCYRKMLV